jgi:predicted RND superfamily exporter protein
MSLVERVQLFGVRRPGLTAILGGVLATVSLVAFARVDLITDITGIVQTPSARTFDRAAKTFQLNERAFVLLEADSQGREKDLLRFATSLEKQLAGKPGITSVEHGLPREGEDLVAKIAIPWGPLFFGKDELPELDRLLTPEGLDEAAKKQASRIALLGFGDAETWAARDPLELGRGLIRRLETLGGGYRFAKGSRDFLSEDGRALLVIVTTTGGTEADSRAQVGAIERAARETLAEPWARGLSWCGTGGCFFEEETERNVRTDLTESLTSSIIICALILAVGFRIWRPDWIALLCAPTLWGTLVGIGLFALVKPRFFVMSVGCAAILVGLGIDYVIHVVCGALELRAGGEDVRPALEGGIRQTWTGLLGSTFTSVAAFVAYQASDQVFLKEMGLLAGAGFLTCLAGAVWLLPVILGRVIARRGPGTPPPRTLGVESSVGFSLARPGLVAGLSLAISIGAIAWLAARPLQLEDDLRNVYARDSKPLAAQARIGAAFGGSHEPVLVLVEGRSEDDVVEQCQRLELPLARLERDGLVVARESIAPFVPPRDEQEHVLELLSKKDGPALARAFQAALERSGFDPGAFEAIARGLEAACALKEPLGLAQLRALGFDPLVKPFVARIENGALGLVVVFPHRDLWRAHDRDELASRLDQALVEAGARGSLTSLYFTSDESARQVSVDFWRVTIVSVLTVTAIVALQFRKPLRIALVLLPPALGLLWTAALFSLVGYKMNLMNLGVLPMLYGVGVDDGIYPVDRYVARPGEGVAAAFRFTGGAMVLCMTTTMVSFGSLALSSNRGISSVGVLTFLGLGLSLLASMTTLPSVLELLRRARS